MTSIQGSWQTGFFSRYARYELAITIESAVHSQFDLPTFAREFLRSTSHDQATRELLSLRVGMPLSLQPAQSERLQCVVENLRGWRTSESVGTRETFVAIDGALAKIPQTDPQPLTFQTLTRFREFTESAIRYEAQSTGTAAFPLFIAPVSAEDLCRAVPVNLERVVVGVERFKGDHFGSLGKTHQMTSAFHLTIEESALKLAYSGEAPKKQSAIYATPELKAFVATTLLLGWSMNVVDEVNRSLEGKARLQIA